MKEWFKARTSWGAAFESLSDAEAGRLAKAVWRYAMTGEQVSLPGAERGVFAIVTMTLSQDIARDQEISAKRSEAAKSSKQMYAFDSNCKQLPANADNKNKNKNQNKREIEKENILTDVKEKRFVPPTVEEVTAYCQERGNNVNPQTFVDFYTSKGWKVGKDPMKDWKACVRTWEGKQRNTSPVRQVVAQTYSQRDYSDADEEAIRRMMEGVI